MYGDSEDPQWFTPDHSDHDPKWFCMTRNKKGQEEVSVCVACVVELLEDEEQLCVKKKLVLGQLVNILHDRKEQLVTILTEDTRVAAHITLIILDLTLLEDESLASLAAEVLYSMLMALQNEEILGCVVDQIAAQALKLCNYKKCLTMFNLLGKLLNNVSLLNAYILQNNGSLVDLIGAGVGYPDPQVQVSLSYICVQLYRTSQTGVDIPVHLSEQVASHLLQTLSSSTPTQELTINLLGLLNTMLNVPELVDILSVGQWKTQSNKKVKGNYSLASALKRVLISRVDVVQAAGVQCIITLLNGVNTSSDTGVHGYIGVLLKEDIAGVESIVRSIEQVQKRKNADLQTQGIQLLAGILANHTGKIRLFSGARLLRQCINVITEAVAHHTNSLSLAAASCLEQLLRREFQSSPPPFTSFVSALQKLVSKFCEQPLMLCCPPSSGVNKLSENGALVQDCQVATTLPPRGKREKSIGQQQQKSSQTQIWLGRFLAVVNGALRLVCEIGDDPVEDEQSYTHPESNVSNVTGSERISSVQDFLIVILALVEETAIPAVLENGRYISDPSVHCSMYNILTYVLMLSPDGLLHTTVERIISLGFIQHALQAKSTFSHGSLTIAADKFLQKLLETLLLSDVTNDMKTEETKENLRKGIGFIHGDLNTVAKILEDNTSADTCTVSLAAVSLLYYSAKYHPESMSEVHLYGALRNTITVMCNVKLVATTSPKPMLKQIIYLHAWSKENIQRDERLPNEYLLLDRQLVECIQTCNSVTDWCVPSIHLLHWCFCDEYITEKLGKVMLECMLCTKCDESIVCHLQDMVTISTNLCKILMILVTSDINEELMKKAFKLLQTLLVPRTWGEANVEVKVVLKSYLPEITHREFLHHSGITKENSLCVLLQLMCGLNMLTLHEPLTMIDTKLLLQVLKWLDRNNNESKTDNVRFGWSFVNVSLLHGRLIHDDRVCSMLLSHPKLLQDLDVCSITCSGIVSYPIYVLGMVMEQSNHFNLQQVEPIKLCLDLEQLVRPLLITENHSLTCSTLLFWIAYFSLNTKAATLKLRKEETILIANTTGNTDTLNEKKNETPIESSTKTHSEPDVPFHTAKIGYNVDQLYNNVGVHGISTYGQATHTVDIHWKRPKHTTTGSELVGGGLSDLDIRVIYIYLLQCIMKNQSVTSDLSVLCLDKLLTFASVNPLVYSHLQNQHWMGVVVSMMYATHSVHNMSHCKASVLTFSAVLLRHNIKYIKPYVQKIVDCLLNATEVVDPAVKLSMKLCCEQMVQNKISPIDAEVKQKLEETICSLEVAGRGDCIELNYKNIERYLFLESAKLYAVGK